MRGRAGSACCSGHAYRPIGQTGTVAGANQETWYKNEESYAHAAAASWIGHAAVEPGIGRFGPAAAVVTALFARHLTDQKQVFRFCLRAFDMNVVYPDGSEEPNPFDPDDRRAWRLTAGERTAATAVVGAFRFVTTHAAAELADVGVPLDPGWPGDLVAIGALLLLPVAGYAIPWAEPPDRLAGLLQSPGISAITRDGRDTQARDGRSERAAVNIDRIRKRVRAEHGAQDLRMAYAGGGLRKTPRTSVVRREVLGELRKRFHADRVTVASIRGSYDRSANTHGGFLRTRLTARLGAQQPKPSKTTLYADFRALGWLPGPGRKHQSAEFYS
jgi:hypothetical protein